MTQAPNGGDAPLHSRIAIIGAGFSGLGMGIQLIKDGEKDFVILERAERLGGTWQANRYPGVECDIQADLYSYSFAPKRDWKKTYAVGAELLGYLEETADAYGVTPHIRYNHTMETATWDAAANHWVIDTSQGQYTADILISAMGYLSEPNRTPDIAGIEDFKGTLLHSADWDTSMDLKGKRVAMIGTGASGCQIVPEIQPMVEQLDVYQRGAPWIMSKHDKVSKGFHAWAMQNLPFYHGMMREYHRLTAEMVVWQMNRPSRMGFIEGIAKSHLKKQVKDPELLKKLTPDYKIGCKRMVFSDTYYPALQKPNVDLITDPIARVTETGIETKDGTVREADILVLATGYQSHNLPLQNHVIGENGTRLSETWKDGQFAYLGATVPGYPNFFMLLGPNTTIAHTSVTLMMEAQIAYVADAMRQMSAKGLKRVDIKDRAATEYNDTLQSDLGPTVWNSGGCTSYYRGGDGKNTTIWPYTTIHFAKRTKRFDIENYETA